MSADSNPPGALIKGINSNIISNPRLVPHRLADLQLLRGAGFITTQTATPPPSSQVTREAISAFRPLPSALPSRLLELAPPASAGSTRAKDAPYAYDNALKPFSRYLA